MDFGTETQVSVPQPSPEERELTRLNLEQARLQSRLTPFQLAFQSPELALAGAIPGIDISAFGPEARSFLEQEAARVGRTRGFEEELLARTQARLRGESFLTPEQEALVEQMFSGARLQGEEDLFRFADELAGGRGMRLTDTPIGGEVLRQRRRLGETLASAEAGAKLDFGSRQQLFEESLRQFQEGLRQQGFQNRLGLTSGLATPGMAIQPLLTGRLAQSTTTFDPGFGAVLSGIGQASSGVGAGAFGLSSLFGGGGTAAAASPAFFGTGLAMGSDRRLKKILRKLSEDPRGFGWYEFEFLDTPGIVRTGVIAQEVQQILPEAVTTGKDGYLYVDYAQVLDGQEMKDAEATTV